MFYFEERHDVVWYIIWLLVLLFLVGETFMLLILVVISFCCLEIFCRTFSSHLQWFFFSCWDLDSGFLFGCKVYYFEKILLWLSTVNTILEQGYVSAFRTFGWICIIKRENNQSLCKIEQRTVTFLYFENYHLWNKHLYNVFTYL